MTARPDSDDGVEPRPEPDSLARKVFEARLEAGLLGGQPQLPRVDRFVLERLLGAGGMGTVWLAHDDKLGRRVALKLVRDEGEAGKRMRLREARGLARIAHPNVIVVYDVGEAEGRVWLAMEFVPGRTLRQCARELEQDQALAHWLAVGRGLVAIHDAGLVHRDVKPDNVLLGDDGRVRVIDLGLVRAVAELQPVDTRTSEVVRTPGFVGTRGYAAPEQLRAGPVDARADQYAFCVALRESLDAARSRGHEALPTALLGALARGRDPDPARRFPDMTALLAALSAATHAAQRGPAGALVTTVAHGEAPSLSLGATREAAPSASAKHRVPPSALRIGHYEVLGELGRGGMGVVYAARDTRLGRKVAIKRLLGGRGDPQSRLYREALAMARLSHPNVIPIYEVVEADEATHIVMEFVEGQTLRVWQARPHTCDEILGVYKAAARGLIAAHHKHLVHRDFKPDNVMLGDDGRVRVMDFGLASVSAQPAAGGGDASAPGELPPASLDLTHPGTLMGTPAYMSPEQLRAAPASAASDVFSFCVALYEALHGERPFAGRTLEELGRTITNGEISPPTGSRVPDWLRALVCRGLAAAPEDRFESMEALLDAIVAGELAAHADPREPPSYVFIAHDSRDKQAVLRLCERLIDLGVRPWLDIWELPPDGERRTASERALLAAPAVIACGRGEYDEALAARCARDPGTVIAAQLPGADGVDLDARHPVVALDEGRWDDGVLELARRVGVDPTRERWLADEAARAGVGVDELSPYRGLEVFREQDARWMFGRDEEVAALMDLIRGGQTRFITLIGASGSGKSSLLLGGVCPLLRGGALGEGPAWTIATLRPGPRPCEALAHALVHLASGDPGTDGPTVPQLRAELQGGREALRRLLGRRAPPGRMLLVIDQLEELFTEAGLGDEGEALAFVRNLLDATRMLAGQDGSLWVAATLRADFVQRGLEVPELAQALQLGTYFALPPMREAQIRAAIERPAARVGYRVETRLVDRLVAAAAHQAGRLPLLQHVLRELWARRDPARRSLREAAYSEAGGLEGTIAVAAERALDGLRRRLGADGEFAARRLMTRLVNLGDRTSEDTRRRVTLVALGDDEATRRVLDVFVREARVLVATEIEGVETVELAHEALLREWTTLVRWLDADRGALKLRQELAQDASRGSSGEYLWGPGRVEEARRMLDASTVELDMVERGFLMASERSVRRRRRWLQVGVAALLAAAAITVAVVNAQRTDAESGRQAAESARQAAEAAQAQAEQAESVAHGARTQAEQDRARAETSQKENERSLKQMFEVALRPLTDRWIAQKQPIGVIEVDQRWTPLLARGERTLVAASLGDSFRIVVAGHESVVSEVDADGRSTFLEITAQWLLADQARRKVAVVTPQSGRDRWFAVLERNLLRLSHEVVHLPALAGAAALDDVGMVILDGRQAPAPSPEEVAAFAAFVRRGGGVLAVGRSRTWLAGFDPAAPPSDHPLTTALAAFGARWSDVDVEPAELAKRDVPAIVRFENRLATAVDLYTRSAGREEFYTALAAGETRELLSAVGSMWLYRATADGKQLGGAEITDKEQTEILGAPVDRPRDRPRPAPAPTPAPDIPAPREPLQLRPQLTDSDLQDARREADAAAKACGKQLQTLISDVTIDVTIGGDGKVDEVAVRPPEKGTPEATCIATAVKALRFPRSRDGGSPTWKLKLY